MRVSLKYPLVICGNDIPQPNRIVQTSTGEQFAIWGECNVLDEAIMPFKGYLVFSRYDIPQANCPVPTPTGEDLTVW